MRFVATALAVGVALGPFATPAGACGDKLLVIGRRVKRVRAAQHPAKVLLYMRPGSALPAAARKMHLESTLRQAGHEVEIVNRAEDLRSQLAVGRYDFVLTDVPDAAAVRLAVGARPDAPQIVPVAYRSETAALRATRETYPVVIRAGKSRSYLLALDAAMGERAER